ncbi:DUF1127 domain-containing protein [Ruegeria sp. Alg231-54]|uniref:DUF1127 domain-containing protein n=1 Tax=Ruegeria sp. Alg231-54 TaxID=1922221 RepID=UPI000D54B9DA|nr:DUF1127 domain-containing protein [Ruegeria sp. Alg231-54]
MAFSSHTDKPARLHAPAAIGAVLAQVGRSALTKARIALKTLQMARMMSTLSNMSDHQLAQIGISRSDIPNYAEKLMAND